MEEALGDRMRSLLDRPGMTERKMFGGTGFMLNGNMVAGTFRGELMVRVGKEAHQAAVVRPGARTMEQGGRQMTGYVVVRSEGTRHDEDLKAWLDLGIAHVAALPRKSAPSARGPRRQGRKSSR